jgi:hypothetical protein
MFGYPDSSRRFTMGLASIVYDVLDDYVIHASLLLSNLSSLIQNDVDDNINATASSSNKYRYQANRSFIIGRVKKCLPRFLCKLCSSDIIDRIYKDAHTSKTKSALFKNSSTFLLF